MSFENKLVSVFAKSIEKVSWIPAKFYNRYLQGNKKVVTVDLRKVGIDFRFPFVISKERGLSSLSAELRCFGIREPLNVFYFTKFLNEKDILLDVGAHFGFFSVLGKKCKKIIAIEPVKNFNRILKANLLMNGIFDKTTILNVALGDGKDVFIEESDSSNLSKVVEQGGERVKSKSLKWFVKKYNINCVKMDIEGYEWDIFKKQQVPLSINKIAMEFHRDLMGKNKAENLIMNLYAKGFRVKYLIEDMPLRFYPFIWFKPFLEYMVHVKKNLSFKAVMNEIWKGRGVKYLYWVRC